MEAVDGLDRISGHHIDQIPVRTCHNVARAVTEPYVANHRCVPVTVVAARAVRGACVGRHILFGLGGDVRTSVAPQYDARIPVSRCCVDRPYAKAARALQERLCRTVLQQVLPVGRAVSPTLALGAPGAVFAIRTSQPCTPAGVRARFNRRVTQRSSQLHARIE